MDILTFVAIPNEFWKGKGFARLYEIQFLNYLIKWGRFGPSKLGYNFFVFQIFVSSKAHL